jgi:Tfp pilus assembly protein PilE
MTLMEMIVVLAILIVLAAIIVPAYSLWKTSASKAVALANMRSLAEACMTFTSQNNGVLPGEDAAGPNTWSAAADPQNANVWYNALPRLLGHKGAGDYAGNPRAFYTKENILFLPGAGYQNSEAKYRSPQFAIAMNSRLQRKSEETKDNLRLTRIQEPSRTALFFEQGVSGEKKTSGLQSRFDGAPKGTARSLAGRYGGKGIIAFVDGHCELFEPKELLTGSGDLPFPQTDVIWTPNPLDNPN